MPTESNDNEDAGDESDTGSTDSSHQSANNNLSIAKLPDPMSCLALDKVGDYVKPSFQTREYVANVIIYFSAYIFFSVFQYNINVYANFVDDL